MVCCENEAFKVIKKYDPKPKNPDGSTRWFLYRWDDGKDGYRKLIRCINCGSCFLVQCYKLSMFADNEGKMHEDWYAVSDEKEADRLNEKYTGLQMERKFKSVYRN